jgi:hypothetical protein
MRRSNKTYNYVIFYLIKYNLIYINMPIKYGELTINHNQYQTDIFQSLKLWLGFELCVNKETKFAFLFEDGEIYDASNNLTDFKFKFLNSSKHILPTYFEKGEKTYFYKQPTIIDNLQKIDFSSIFSSFNKFKKSNNLGSYYNSIYYHHKSSEKPEVFGLIHIKSSEIMPRYQFAYDSDEFTKEEIVYLIHYIFNS